MKKGLVIAMAAWLCSSPGWAEITASDLPPSASLFAAPADEMGVPEAVVRAIAMVESGLKPWVLNIEGKAYHFHSKKEALGKAEEAWAAGRSFDVGLMQVNKWWLAKYGISLEAALDPVANVYFGVWILKEELLRHGSLRAAVGAYHSPAPARAGRYADQVMAILEGKTPRKNPPKTQAKKQKKTVHSTPNKEIQKPRTILIAAPDRVSVKPGSMKVSGTAAENSMKVGM